MSLQERVIVSVLSAFDFVMDLLTSSDWSYEQGNAVPDVTVKE